MFESALDAAVCYARHMLTQGSVAAAQGVEVAGAEEDNEEVRNYQKVALKIERNKKRIESLGEVKRGLFTSQESIITKLKSAFV